MAGLTQTKPKVISFEILHMDKINMEMVFGMDCFPIDLVSLLFVFSICIEHTITRDSSTSMLLFLAFVLSFDLCLLLVLYCQRTITLSSITMNASDLIFRCTEHMHS